MKTLVFVVKKENDFGKSKRYFYIFHRKINLLTEKQSHRFIFKFYSQKNIVTTSSCCGILFSRVHALYYKFVAKESKTKVFFFPFGDLELCNYGFPGGACCIPLTHGADQDCGTFGISGSVFHVPPR